MLKLVREVLEGKIICYKAYLSNFFLNVFIIRVILERSCI